ncbi:UNVERIFIED_ORG: hypothetical protein J2Y81_007814 [Paraburkholderia sediminicola]|nr:hypothetical protein [Paraburkholderia sediminicola]
MAKQTLQPNPDQVAITKGKSPRNALIGVGVVIAVLVGAIGFYYQTQESSRADEERRAEKAARTAAAVEKPRSHDVDLDKMIADQAKAGQQQADAAAAASAAKGANPAAASSRGTSSLVTADAFLQDERTRGLANSAQSDSIYASPIFRPGVKVMEPAMSPAQAALATLPTPQQMAVRQAQAEQGAVNNPALQAQLQALKALSGMGGTGGVGGAGGQGNAALSTTQDRDTQFMQNAGDHSSNGAFKRAGFVGQSRGCTLSPPHHINVLALEGLNSDRPGTASLVVENDVYDTCARCRRKPATWRKCSVERSWRCNMSWLHCLASAHGWQRPNAQSWLMDRRLRRPGRIGKRCARARRTSVRSVLPLLRNRERTLPLRRACGNSPPDATSYPAR